MLEVQIPSVFGSLMEIQNCSEIQHCGIDPFVDEAHCCKEESGADRHADVKGCSWEAKLWEIVVDGASLLPPFLDARKQ